MTAQQSLKTAALAVLLGTVLGAPAYAMSEAERAAQMEQAREQGVVAAPAQTSATMQPVMDEQPAATMQAGRISASVREEVMADGTPVKVTVSPDVAETTVEKTISKNYTVTKRKVGLVGGRPYPASTEEVGGGTVIQRQVGNAEATTQVIVADPLEGVEPATGGDYYSNQEKSEVYEAQPFNVRVHRTGGFND